MLRCRARQLALDGKFVKEVMGGGARPSSTRRRALPKRDKSWKEAVTVTEASFPPGAVIARKVEKEESGARLKMR